MLRRIAALLIVLSLSLLGCTASATSGMTSYVDSIDGYQFLYPLGWTEVKVTNGPDVVLHDLIEPTENVSIVINPVPNQKTLEDLGSPGEVGYQLSKSAIAPTGSNRKAELVTADSREFNGKTYYTLEYAVQLPNNQQRHNLASVVVSNGRLYTLNASTTEQRWPKVHRLLTNVVNSFSVN